MLTGSLQQASNMKSGGLSIKDERSSQKDNQGKE